MTEQNENSKPPPSDDDLVTIIPAVEDTRPGETITPPSDDSADKGDVDGVATRDDAKPQPPGLDAPFETIVAPVPSVGRIVLYVLPTGPVRPAIVLEADGYLVHLHVFTRKHDPLAGGALQEEVPYCPEPQPGSWHWPPRR